MQFSSLEEIEKRILEIKEIVFPEDYYYIADLIVTNLYEIDLEKKIKIFLKNKNYNSEVSLIVLKKIKQIQKIKDN